MMLMLTTAVSALVPMCEQDTIEINTNCTMITPPLNCSGGYTYNIFNGSGYAVTNGTLKQFADTMYYLNFTEDEGDYLVRLCDGAVREVRVTQEDDGKMILGALILIPMFLAFFLLIGGISLDKEHAPLKIFLFLLGIIFFWTSLHFGMVSVVQFYNFPILENLIGSTTWWTGMIFFIILSYFCIYIIYKAFRAAAQDKKSKLNY